jgi:hypothetical protein
MDGSHQRTINKALQIVRTKERLSLALDIPLTEVERYLNGERMPQQVFIQALDIVAGAPVQNKPKRAT